MQRLLIISDPDSLWTKRYIENVLHPAGCQVTIYPIYGWQGGYREEYAKWGVTIYEDTHKLPVIGRIPKVRMWARVLANAASLKNLGPFDAVHCHYLSVVDLALGCTVARQQRAKVVATFWGSDLLRADEKTLGRMEKYLRRCHRVTVFNPEHVERIRALYGPDVVAKTEMLDFGSSVFAWIDRMQADDDRAAVKAQLGIAADRLTVAIGSSASEAQQQLPAIQALAALDEATLRRMPIDLQHTCCHAAPANEQKVQAAARALPCQTVVLNEFMNDEESARLRCAVDVYLHTIRTDAFSDSMKEYFYAGARVAYGSWLCYPTLAEMGIQARQFAAFDQLPALVEAALEGSWQPIGLQEKARLADQASWDKLAPKWLALYR